MASGSALTGRHHSSVHRRTSCRHMNTPRLVEKYIADEMAAGNLIEMGPSTTQPIQINRIGVIPKGHTPGRWRIITDLSFPRGQSVNDGIPAERCSFEYTTVDRVAGAALALGRGALLAKIDIKSAYRLIPVHPVDRPLYWAASGKGKCMLMGSSRLGYDLPQRFLMPWQMHWSSASGRKG